MGNQSQNDEIAGARAYEALHVPALFEQWCTHVLDGAGVRSGDRVLDLACGTGVLAREAANRVGPSGKVCGVDPGSGMLAVAQEVRPDVEWKDGVAEAIPYASASFDAVISQFGMMFFTDRELALREMLRVLKPGGRLAVAVWESLDNSEAYPIEVALLERLAGKDAADALRAPFVLGNKVELEALFTAAGVTSVSVQTFSGTARFPTIRAMVEADLRGWLPIMGVVLSEETIDAILEEAEGALAEYVTDQGQVMFDAPAHIVTGGTAAV